MNHKVLMALVLPFIMLLFLVRKALSFIFCGISSYIVCSFYIQRSILLFLFLLI